jgi:glycosyltransferase involved in cell wall biosynthesis
LAERGHEVLTYPWGRRKDTESYVEKILGRPLDALRLAARLRQSRLDLVLGHTGFDSRTLPRDILLLFAVGARPCRIIELHGSRVDLLSRKGHQVFRLAASVLMRNCDAVFVLSSEERELLLAAGAHDVRVVKNPLDTGAQVTRLEEREKTLLFVGRLVREKGVLDLVRAWCLARRDAEWSLVIAGEGPVRSEVERLVRHEKLEDSVTLTGHVEGPALERLYGAASAFVLPTYWPEGFPTVLAEAMSHGLPIITTPVRGARDWLHEGRNCLFVPPRDPQSLAEAMLRMLSTPGLRDAMGRQNLLDVKMFDIQPVLDEYERAINSVCSARTRSGVLRS